MNYEGTDGVEQVIQQAKLLKSQHGVHTESNRSKTSSKAPALSRLNSTSETKEPSSIPAPPLSTVAPFSLMQKSDPLPSPIKSRSITGQSNQRTLYVVLEVHMSSLFMSQ